MKKSRKSLMLLPLLAICLSGCYEIIPEDAPEEIEDEFTPEGSYTLPEEDTSESSSIPYESTSGTESTGEDNTSTPSESTGGDSSSDSGKPSEPDDPTGPSESGSGSSSSSETHEYSYSLQITNKEDLASLTLDENDSSSNIYTLSISLITYDYDIQLPSKTATEDDVTITSSNEAALKVDGLTLIPQVGGGETTISATWKEHSEASDSFAVTVDYIPYTPTESYEYKLVIENKEELGSTWKITDTKQNVDHTLEVKLYEYKYLDSELADDYPIVKDASLSDVNISFTDDSVLEVSNDSISLYPTGVGSTDVTLTWIEHPEATDTFSVIVEEVTYEYNHTLAITNSSDFSQTDDDNAWRVGDSYKTLSVSLTSTTYTGSTDSSIESTIDGDSNNVSVSITPAEGSPENGLTNWGLNLMANSAGTYTVTATWIGHEEATDSITVLVKEKTSESYTMSVSSEDVSSIEAPWYVEDEESRSFSFTITPDDGDGVDLPYNDNDIIVLHSSSELQIDSSVDNGTITITPVGITNNVTVTLFVYWTVHTEAHITLTLTLNQHAYEISITNDTELAADWSVEDGYRTVVIQATKDGTTYDQDPYIELIPGGDDANSITIDGLNITPVSEGNPTVTAIWYKYDPTDPTYADSNIVHAISDSVQLKIDENIKPVSISLSTSSITLNAYYDTDTLSATVLGASGEQATEQGVTWSADTGIVLTDVDDNSITVSVTGYNIEGNITCTSVKDPTISATCSVLIGDQPNPDGPQAGDTTYKLGCKKSDGSYVFFDGTISSSHLQITEDWEQAADIYVTPNKYEMSENGCTLSFYDSNGTLQYLASSESSSSKGNMKLSTTPYRWVWDSYNGYSFFSAPAFEDRYIGLSSSDDFRTYAQSSLSSDVPVYPYSEIPEDYDYGNEEEPETGEEDGTYVLAALCDNNEYRYFNGTVSSNHAQTTTTYSEATRVTIDGFDQTQDCSCVLTYKDSSGSTKYLAYGGSGTNVSASSSSYTWNWSVEDGCFYASTDSTRYLSNQTGYNYFSAYTSSNGTYKVVPYAEDPVNGSPTGLTINSNSNQVIVGHELQLTATVLPEGNVNNSITWSSSDESYASVDQTGLVTGNAVCESVTITATLNGYPEITDSITLTIVSEESKEFIESDQFKVSDYSSSYDDGTSLDGVSFALNACSFKFNKNGGTATAYYSAGIRFYRYNQIIFTNPDPSFELIDTITITCTTSSYMGADNGVAQNGSITATDTSSKTITITADYSNVQSNDYDIIFQNCITGSSNTQLRFTQIDITYKRA